MKKSFLVALLLLSQLIFVNLTAVATGKTISITINVINKTFLTSGELHICYTTNSILTNSEALKCYKIAVEKDRSSGNMIVPYTTTLSLTFFSSGIEYACFDQQNQYTQIKASISEVQVDIVNMSAGIPKSNLYENNKVVLCGIHKINTK